MTTIHPQFVGDQAILPRADFERLLALARRSEAIDLQAQEDEVPTRSLMRLAERGGSFAFWHEDGEDIYSPQDGEPV
jgi:hypothetical protein